MAGAVAISAWEIIEWLANFFYDPELFWSVPLVLAALWAIYRRWL